MRVRTVRGDINSQTIGITMPHEHIFVDGSCNWHAPQESYLRLGSKSRRSTQALSHFAKYADEPVKMENLWVIHRDPYVSRDNLVLADQETAIRELMEFKSAGGRTVVDLTSTGIGPQPALLRQVAERTGLNIIAGCGYYIASSHPPSLATTETDKIAKGIQTSIEVGIDGSDVKAGIIGEIGVSTKMRSGERKVLKAAAQAHLSTGAPINVHVTPFGKEGNRIIDLLEQEGVDLCHVILSHMDVVIDLDYQSHLAKRGVYIEYDDFGEEEYIDSIGFVNPRDTERVTGLKRLMQRGFTDQLLVSQDVCQKMYLKTYGGLGYDHILRNVIPMMKRAKISNRAIEKLIVDNPSQALSF